MENGQMHRPDFYDVVFGFASYLTTLHNPIKIGASEDASPIVDLASKFCEENGSFDCTDSFPNNIKFPQEE